MSFERVTPSAKAERHLDAVAAAREALAEEYAKPYETQSRERVSGLHQAINVGLKFGEVHALLAIADELRDINRTNAEDRGLEISEEWA